MITSISSKGQIVIPAEIRRQDCIEPGQQFAIKRINCGEYRFKKVSRRRNEGSVDLLLACPATGWFKPMDR